MCVTLYRSSKFHNQIYMHIIRMVIVIGALLHKDTNSEHKTGYLTIYISCSHTVTTYSAQDILRMQLRMLCNMLEQLQLPIWCNVWIPCRPIPDPIYGFHIGHSPRTQQLPALAVIAPAFSSQTDSSVDAKT